MCCHLLSLLLVMMVQRGLHKMVHAWLLVLLLLREAAPDRVLIRWVGNLVID